MNVVFAIGCKRYRDPDVARLQYADRDARRFVETVMGTQDPDNTEKYLLHDEHENEGFRPTRANILYFLSQGERRDKRTELDFLFFYFSGHGWSSQHGIDYLLTSDSIVTMPEDTAISVQKLEGHLKNWKAKHSVLFIDACRTVMTGGKGSITIPEDSRIDVDSLRIPEMVTFCSCEPGQTSYEADPIRSGVFTEAVCKALSDEGRCSTIQELDKYLNDKVPRISDTYGLPRQIPYSRVEPLAVRNALIVSQRTREAWQVQERRKRLNGLYAEARRLYQDRDWHAVVDIFAQIHSEDPTYPDPKGLLASAREALEAQESARRVAALYAEGQRHMKAKEWQQALECFKEVQRLEPGYRNTEGLLSWVRRVLLPDDPPLDDRPPTPKIKIPDLSGQEISQASRVLTDAGLNLGAQNKVANNAIPEGQIIELIPQAGTEVEAGSVVSITVSSGPQKESLLAVLAGSWWAMALRGLVIGSFGLAGLVLQDDFHFRFSYALMIIADGVIARLDATTRDDRRRPLLIQSRISIIVGLFVLLVWLVNLLPQFGLPDLSGPFEELAVAPRLIGSWAIFIGIIHIIAALQLRWETKNLWLMGTSGVLLAVFGIALWLRVSPSDSTWWLLQFLLLVSGIALIAVALRLRDQ